ncbi:site-specific integrase [Mesorhizobium mediterraneum]|uniref:site-specific integrase n=1 Tax=Mesorhizobium mediterraneum TaxID=43617 RepID=UPI001AED26EA|nr:site-specific integrase [Mesorhizobium mediterraneum]
MSYSPASPLFGTSNSSVIAPSQGTPLEVGADRTQIVSAITCTDVRPPISQNALTDPPALFQQFITNSLSDNSKRGYQADLAQYGAFGGTIPCSSERIAEYLAARASTHRPATIARYLASLSKAHRAIGVEDPCKAEIVKATFRGIRRVIGTAQREAKPLLREDLFQILERMGNRPKDLRDKALLLIGFAGAFRRSELIGLDLSDVEHVRQGIIITLRRSKTDQTGAGRKIGVPFGRTRWCPVRGLSDWVAHAATSEGPIFRLMNRHGHISDQRLSGEAVSIIIKERAEAAGFDPVDYSGHSLRAGLATSAAMAGASSWKIRAQTGHASDAMLARYIRNGNLFENNAAGAIL